MLPVRSINRCLHLALQWMIIQSFGVLSVLGGLCSKAVPVQRQTKKVHVLRRLPAACSNWDKAWTWLTKVDCGTKYRLDYVTEPPSEAITYRIKYVCCPGDTECMGKSDEKFLAIILGSTGAALLILGLVIVLSLLHKRRKLRCPVVCEGGSHIYETAEDIDEAAELQGNRGTCVEETNNKVCESEYEEIRDCKRGKGDTDDDGLPRYADLFSEKKKLAQELGVDPPFPGETFKKATAPPAPEHLLGASEVPQSNVQEVLTSTARILADTVQHTADDSDRIYYNIDAEDSIAIIEQEGAKVTSNETTNCALSDSKTNTDCSNYEKLIEPDNLSEVDNHEYQKLVDVQSPGNGNEKCVVEASVGQVTMNGHLEAQSC